ncbi:hypothetical protein, partial [Neisseria polysaccharea]|uniref:hypothetical protein n=1 Tax=Neisseria polysaccharea TaxID=489 RepID=UPI001F1F3120
VSLLCAAILFAFAFGFGRGASVVGLVFYTLICTRFFVLLAVSGSIGVGVVFAKGFLYIAVFYFVLCVGVGRGWGAFVFRSRFPS